MTPGPRLGFAREPRSPSVTTRGNPHASAGIGEPESYVQISKTQSVSDRGQGVLADLMAALIAGASRYGGIHPRRGRAPTGSPPINAVKCSLILAYAMTTKRPLARELQRKYPCLGRLGATGALCGSPLGRSAMAFRERFLVSGSSTHLGLRKSSHPIFNLEFTPLTWSSHQEVGDV